MRSIDLFLTGEYVGIGDKDYLPCHGCGALVLLKYVEDHSAFHEAVSRAFTHMLEPHALL